jgi:hypothetical protein
VLANTSQQFGNLQTLRLALSLAQRDPALIPEPLQEQVRTIIQQATDIVADPRRIGVDTWPESIALAYAMRTNPELSNDVSRLMAMQRLDTAIAGATLQHLDAAFVT